MEPILIKDFRKLKEDWDNAAKAENFRDNIAQFFDEEKAFKESGEKFSRIIANFLSLYNISWKGKRVAELGCGAGRLTEFIAKEASHVLAIDISAEMLKRLHERLGHPKNIETICIIRDYSVIEDLSVDLIISYLVFQHTPEEMVERLIQDGRRILKEGGYYFFQIPLQDKHTCVPCGFHALDMVYWTLDEVKALATKYNFKIIHAEEGQYFIFQKLKQ